MRTHHFTSLTLLVASASAALFTRTARAQDYEEEIGPHGNLTPIYTRYGVGVTLGGGIEDFTNHTAHSATNIAGSWDVRVELGTVFPVSLEAAYMGTAQKIDELTGTQNANLLGTILESDIKLNVPTGTSFRPFLFAGMGWRRYDVTDASFTTADEGIADSDDEMVFPLGGGLRYDYRGLDADVRFTYRPAVNENLITEGTGFAAMHTWGIAAHIGANL